MVLRLLTRRVDDLNQNENTQKKTIYESFIENLHELRIIKDYKKKISYNKFKQALIKK